MISFRHKLITCPKSGCGQKFCTNPKCVARNGEEDDEPFDIEGHEGRTCDEVQQKYMEDGNHEKKKDEILEMAERNGWTKCPVCKIPKKKRTGCNKMTCENCIGPPEQRTPAGQRKRVFYCYTCGANITDVARNGYAHFYGNNGKGPNNGDPHEPCVHARA